MSTASSQVSPSEPRRPQASSAQRTAEAKAAFTASLKSVGANIDSELQARAKNIHAMDQSLSKQEKDLQKDTKKLSKQSDEMQKFLDKSNKQFASFDDLGSLHEGLDADLGDIEEMLRALEEDDPPRNDH